MNYLTILAETGAASAAETTSEVVPLDFIWEQITSLNWLQAVLGISFGAVYLLYGWRIFKILVVICFGLIGMFAGIEVGARFDAEPLGGTVGLLLVAAISVPLMRWGVSILGAAAGGVLGAGIWYAVGLPEEYILAGAVTGIVAGGMIGFIIFKIAVMLFTSLGGGLLISVGLLALFYQYEQIQEPPTEKVKELLYQENWFMPVMLLVPTIIGVLVQNKLIKKSKDWGI
jgi:hypothetical protein